MGLKPPPELSEEVGQIWVGGSWVAHSQRPCKHFAGGQDLFKLAVGGAHRGCCPGQRGVGKDGLLLLLKLSFNVKSVLT